MSKKNGLFIFGVSICFVIIWLLPTDIKTPLLYVLAIIACFAGLRLYSYYKTMLAMNKELTSMLLVTEMKDKEISQMFGRNFNLGQGEEEPDEFRVEKNEVPAVRFDDVAGCDEEKEEVKEIIDFLKNNDKYKAMGATIPKGILFAGPPGTGKTMLARAIAGEADVHFMHVSASEFMEKYVGTGASRIRKLFKKARENAPALIFIDEIDTIGKQRSGDDGGNTEAAQTLNQLLVEMDGFDKKSNVVVIAATNRPEILDKALLRAGRFDRQISFSLPDVKAREEILKVHAKNKKLAANVSLKEVASKTYGFSGADLASVLNEAALLSVRTHQNDIPKTCIYEAIDRVMMGPAKKSRKYTENDKRKIATHEAGHAIVGLILNQRKVERITIVPRGSAGGYTSYSQEDNYLPTSKELKDNITSLLGGRAAEQLVYNEITTGASNDLKVATTIARSMVTEYGMSTLGLVQYENSRYSGYRESKTYSEQTAAKIEDEIKHLIDESYSEALTILKKYRAMLDAFVEELLKKDTLNSEDIVKIAKPFISA